MGNGKKAVNGVPRRPQPPEEGQEGEPQDFVVVIAHTSTDGEVEEGFGKMIQDIKALYTFKNNVRAYGLVDDAAKDVLSKVEKPSGGTLNKTVMVISYDMPEDGDIDEGYARLTRTADKVRDLFKDEPDVRVDIAVRDIADEVLGVFGIRGEE